jgi:hypothetical protein
MMSVLQKSELFSLQREWSESSWFSERKESGLKESRCCGQFIGDG